MSRRARWGGMRMLTLAGLLAAVGLGGGCGGGSDGKPQPPNEANLQTLAVLYGRYLQQHQGKSPPDEAEFKKFIAAMPPEQRGTGNKSTVEELLVSPRDNLPYVIRYNVPTSGPGCRSRRSSPTSRAGPGASGMRSTRWERCSN